jgi:hypothetical protein
MYDEELYKSEIDMICSSAETANYMTGELNAGRFYNVPAFRGHNCRAIYWIAELLYTLEDECVQFVVWYDPIDNTVFLKQPKERKTLLVVLHHHYAEGLMKGSKLCF